MWNQSHLHGIWNRNLLKVNFYLHSVFLMCSNRPYNCLNHCIACPTAILIIKWQVFQPPCRSYCHTFSKTYTFLPTTQFFANNGANTLQIFCNKIHHDYSGRNKIGWNFTFSPEQEWESQESLSPNIDAASWQRHLLSIVLFLS